MSLHPLEVGAVKYEVNEVVSITFNNYISFKAGQFLTFVFQQSEREIRRSYSPFSSPLVDEPLQIAVKLIENGEISRFLHHQIQVGDILQVKEANGLFAYDIERDKYRSVFLFAAGVGITPIFSILKTALVAEQNSKIVLIYSSRSAEDTLFLNEIAAWQQKYPKRLTVIHLFSNAKNLRLARLNSFLIKELITENIEFDREDALFYTCGPVDYMDLCRISVLGEGYLPQQVKRETFVLHEDEIDEDDTTEKITDTNTYTVNLVFKGQTHHLEVPYPKRILDVALANHINIPYSCSGGVCGTCVGNCISGNVKMTYNEVLTDDEVAQGRVLICTGRPTENDTTIVW